LASLLGAGPRWTKIQVVDGTLRVKHGWVFRLDVPLADVESARPVTERPLAWGVHPAKDGWLVNGSRRGIVEVRFTRPVKPKTPLGPGANWLGAYWSDGSPRALYISVTEPAAFAVALTSQR
jgi:hypothetical protein